jgi:hypothetical protein
MMYFIPWALLLLVVILAVPIAAFLEQKKSRAAYQGMGDGLDDDEEERGEDEGDVVAEEGEAEAVSEEADEFGGGDFGSEDLADDEFAAFQ